MPSRDVPREDRGEGGDGTGKEKLAAGGILCGTVESMLDGFFSSIPAYGDYTDTN